jgi:hypothetical protein
MAGDEGWSREVMFRAGVNPIPGACGKNFPVFHAPSRDLSRSPRDWHDGSGWLEWYLKCNAIGVARRMRRTLVYTPRPMTLRAHFGAISTKVTIAG